MKIISTLKIAIYACAIASAAFTFSHVNAQEQDKQAIIDILPAKTLNNGAPSYTETNDTHPPLKLSPDKSELIRLDKEAGSIIIGSPTHLSVLADSAKTLVLVPQVPGATYVTILDKQGSVLMQRHVIVAPPKEKYVRIRKSCASGAENCEPTQVYYCPDMCHKVSVAQEATPSTSNAETSDTPSAVPQPVEDTGAREEN